MNNENTFEPFPVYQNRVSLFEIMNLDNESIVFLGDSISQRNEWAEMFQNQHIKNRGIDSDRVGGVLLRLKQITQAKPKKVFLKIGINDISDERPDEYILNTYREIVKGIRSEASTTRLYIQSILPVNNTTYNHWINNKDVQRINHSIKKLAEEYKCTYIDLYSHFVTQKNELHPDYTYDGVHLSGKGYDNLKSHIEEFVS